MKGNKVNPHIGLILKVIPLKLVLDMVSSFPANVTTCVAKLFLQWRMHEDACKATWVHVSKIGITG